MKRSAVPLLATVALLAGCGGDDDATEARPPSTTGAAATVVGTTPPGTVPTTEADDLAIAKAGRLVRADLPAGWEEGPSDPDAKSPCPAIEAAKRATSARRAGSTFTRDGGEIGSNVYVYATPAEAQRNMESFAGDGTLACIARTTLAVYVDAAKKTAGARATSRGTSRPDLTGGDDRRALRATVAYTTKSGSTDVSFSVAVVRVGRALAVLGVTAVPDPGLQRATTRAVLRLTAAQSAGR